VWCMTIPLVDIQTYRVYIYCIYSIYTFLYIIFIYSCCSKNVRDLQQWFLVQFILLGLWLSCYTNTVVHDLTFSVILLALSLIVCMLMWANLILQHMSIICSPFSGQLVMSNFPLVLLVFCLFFT
jgi:hypothetical protein